MLQVRGRSPQKKVTIRSDKLFIDNVMYCYDDDKHEVAIDMLLLNPQYQI